MTSVQLVSQDFGQKMFLILKEKQNLCHKGLDERCCCFSRKKWTSGTKIEVEAPTKTRKKFWFYKVCPPVTRDRRSFYIFFYIFINNLYIKTFVQDFVTER